MHHSLVFKSCGHSDFYFGPRGTQIKTGAITQYGEINCMHQAPGYSNPERTRHRLTTAHIFPVRPWWAELGDPRLEMVCEALNSFLILAPKGFSVISELGKAGVHSLQTKSSLKCMHLKQSQQSRMTSGSQKGQPRNESRQSLS